MYGIFLFGCGITGYSLRGLRFNFSYTHCRVVPERDKNRLFEKASAMKNIFCSFLFVLALAVNGIAQPTRFNNAVEYNDFIVRQQTKVGEAIKEFITVFTDTNDSTKIQESRNQIAIEADSAVARVKRLVSFQGDTAFKQSSIRLYRFYASIARVEYDQIVRVSYNKSKKAEDIQKEIGAIVQDITEREKKVDADFVQAQKAFAAKHQFTLTSDTGQSNQ